jgi:competence protein ComEC
VLPALRSLGVRRLDVVVATHADLDHSGGLASVLEGLPVGEVWVPRGRRDELVELVAAAARLGVPVREQDARAGATRVGNLEVEILWPPGDGRTRGRNDSSLVLRIEVEGTRILLTGDIGESAERALLASGVDLRADVLKLPHHGSRRSATLPFLEAVGAEIALLSAPCSPRSRLPTFEAFERARRVGMPVWWTGRDGALWVQLRKPPVRRVVWGWQSDPNCRPPVSRLAPRRT